MGLLVKEILWVRHQKWLTRYLSDHGSTGPMPPPTYTDYDDIIVPA